MIAFIKGKVFSYGLDWVILSTNGGVGYRIFTAHKNQLKMEQDLLLFTHHHIREDDQQLFGFFSQDELVLFQQLISVKGLGPKTALTMMNASSYSQLVGAIESQNVNYLRSMPGIGPKTASQIVLDLKGKLVETSNKKAEGHPLFQDVLTALKSLGYKANELNGLDKELMHHLDKPLDECIKLSLKWILTRKGGF